MDAAEAQRLLVVAREAEPQLTRADADVRLDRLELERDALRAAIDWYAAHGDGDHAVELAGAIWPFWLQRGHVDEGRQLLARALATPHAASSSARAKARRGAGMLAFRQGENDTAEGLFRASIEDARVAGDRRQLATLS